MSERIHGEDERYGVTYHGGIRYVHGLSQTNDEPMVSVLPRPAADPVTRAAGDA